MTLAEDLSSQRVTKGRSTHSTHGRSSSISWSSVRGTSWGVRGESTSVKSPIRNLGRRTLKDARAALTAPSRAPRGRIQRRTRARGRERANARVRSAKGNYSPRLNTRAREKVRRATSEARASRGDAIREPGTDGGERTRCRGHGCARRTRKSARGMEVDSRATKCSRGYLRVLRARG